MNQSKNPYHRMSLLFRYGQREGIHIEIDDPLILEELSCAQLHKGIGPLEFSFGHRILCAQDLNEGKPIQHCSLVVQIWQKWQQNDEFKRLRPNFGKSWTDMVSTSDEATANIAKHGEPPIGRLGSPIFQSYFENFKISGTTKPQIHCVSSW